MLLKLHRITIQRKLICENDMKLVNENILLPNIYLKLREMDFNNKILLESMKNDKKRIGNFLTVIIPDKDFRMIKVDDVTDMEFDSVMNTLKIICLK